MPLRRSIEEVFHLDVEEFEREVAQLNEEDLLALHKLMKRKWVTSNVNAGASIGGTLAVASALGPVGWALGAASTAYSLRRSNVHRRKKDIVRARLDEMGWDGYHFRKRDYIIPCTAAGAGAIAGPVAGHVFGQASSHATTQAGEFIIHQGGKSATKFAVKKATQGSMLAVSNRTDAIKAKNAHKAATGAGIGEDAQTKNGIEVEVSEVDDDEINDVDTGTVYAIEPPSYAAATEEGMRAIAWHHN